MDASEQECPVEAEARPPERHCVGLRSQFLPSKELQIQKGKKGRGIESAYKPSPSAQWKPWVLHGNARPSLFLPPPRPPGENGFLLFTGEDEKETKHHKQVACQGPQGSRGSLQGSGVPEGQALSKSDLSHTQEGPSLLHLPALRQGVEKTSPHSQASKRLSTDPGNSTPAPSLPGAPKMKPALPEQKPDSPVPSPHKTG